MFQVKVKGKDYKVVFQHVDDNSIYFITPKEREIALSNSRSSRPVRRNGTYCHLMVLSESETKEGDKPYWVPLFTGITVIHPGEQRVHNIGRKESLTRALQLSGFDRDDRAEFWKKYFEMRGKVD